MGQSPEVKYAHLQAEIQRAILHNFPNEERTGCPAESTVREIAQRPDRITAEDDSDERSVWFHVTHCSPCYRNFLELRAAERAYEQSRSRIFRRLAVAIAFAAVGALGWFLWIVMTGHR
jgi:hypothetical protein